MKMIVGVVGTVIRSSVKKGKGRSLSFNLKPVDEDDIYHVISMGPGQRQMLSDLLADRERVDVIVAGHAFTYRSRDCNKHHITIKPLFIVPLDSYDRLDALSDVISQWFMASLLANGHRPQATINPDPPVQTVFKP
jgi:hypothetical protein